MRGALDRSGPVNFTQADLDMYLSACKFLDTSLAFPAEKIPLFQMYEDKSALLEHYISYPTYL